MSTLLSFHLMATIRGDGLLPELAAILERRIPKVAEPVDALPNSEAPLIVLDGKLYPARKRRRKGERLELQFVGDLAPKTGQ